MGIVVSDDDIDYAICVQSQIMPAFDSIEGNLSSRPAGLDLYFSCRRYGSKRTYAWRPGYPSVLVTLGGFVLGSDKC